MPPSAGFALSSGHLTFSLALVLRGFFFFEFRRTVVWLTLLPFLPARAALIFYWSWPNSGWKSIFFFI